MKNMREQLLSALTERILTLLVYEPCGPIQLAYVRFLRHLERGRRSLQTI